MNKDKKVPTTQCSFCNKNAHEVKKLISGSGVSICNECVDLCHNIIKSNSSTSGSTKKKKDKLLPKQISRFLDKGIIGQKDAKKILSVAIYNHYKRISYTSNETELQKSNILMIGPTGCGKTLLAKNLAKTLDVPFASSDATSLTESGYVGDDVENIISRLYQAADCDVEKAEKGIVYIDEIDKIAKKIGASSTSRDISGEGVQQNLLKMVEGTVVLVPAQLGKKSGQQEHVQINTKDILFICAGSFPGIEKIIRQKQNPSSIGFEAKIKDEKNSDIFDKNRINDVSIDSDDIIKYGFISEFIGRFPIISLLHSLDEKDLLKILNDYTVNQYKILLKMDNTELNITPDALQEIVKKAKEKKTGARSLRSIMEDILLDVMFEVPSTEGDYTKKLITISKDIVLNKSIPEIIYLHDSDKKLSSVEKKN